MIILHPQSSGFGKCPILVILNITFKIFQVSVGDCIPNICVMFNWGFPKIGVPRNHHPFLDGIFPDKNQPAIWGYPMIMETPIYS